LIEELGYIAASTERTFARLARDLLLSILKTAPASFEQGNAAIFACLRCRNDDEIKSAILAKIRTINLVEFFVGAGAEAGFYLNNLLHMGIDDSKKQALVYGLREGRQLNLLANIMIESDDHLLAHLAGYQLFEMSSDPEFMDFLDNYDANAFRNELEQYVDSRLKRWGWPLPNPDTVSGQRLAIAVGYHTAKATIAQEAAKLELPEGQKQNEALKQPYWMAYVTRMVMSDLGLKSTSAISDDSEPLDIVYPVRLMEKIWSFMVSRSLLLNRLSKAFISETSVDNFAIPLILSSSILIIGVLSFLGYEILVEQSRDFMKTIADLEVLLTALTMMVGGLISFKLSGEVNIFTRFVAGVVMPVVLVFALLADRKSYIGFRFMVLANFATIIVIFLLWSMYFFSVYTLFIVLNSITAIAFIENRTILKHPVFFWLCK
jgi:hypothetical protein